MRCEQVSENSWTMLIRCKKKKKTRHAACRMPQRGASQALHKKKTSIIARVIRVESIRKEQAGRQAGNPHTTDTNADTDTEIHLQLQPNALEGECNYARCAPNGAFR